MRAGGDVVVLPDGTRLRLAPGRHSSPVEGVCVIELASQIGGEEFSDRPRCVCPVIAAFLRGWNDRAGHAERQRLGPYAARVVGSRSNRRVTRRRRELCLEVAGVDLHRGWIRRRLSLLRMRGRIAIFCGPRAALRLDEGAGDFAARLAVARGDTEGAFELLEAMLAAGGKPPGGRSSANGTGTGAPGQNGAPHAAVNGTGPPPAREVDRRPAGDPRVTVKA